MDVSCTVHCSTGTEKMSCPEGGQQLLHLFREQVHLAVSKAAPARSSDDIEDYLSFLLYSFVRTDSVFAIRGADGRRLTSVFEMLAEGDVRLNADSFERERSVHKHIGDYILFWSGVNPDFLRRLKLDDGRDLVCDYTRQGKDSYLLVSTFDYVPYATEAPMFRKLSEGFESLAMALQVVAHQLPFRVA
ncbi:MAG: hypothetical protein JSS66_11350 [Armatimonadetes bacterium]|nr:hypothetical protein [Armatimonadota bacterium]